MTPASATPNSGPYSVQTPPGSWVAALLARSGPQSLHMGLHYRNADRGNAVLHLAWENRLEVIWDLGGLYAVPDVDAMRLRQVAWRCTLVARRSRQPIPYALVWSGATFDQQGRLALNGTAHGLTCATFVLALFASDGIALVDDLSWPPRPGLAKALATQAAAMGYPEIGARIADEAAAGAKRILPQEVFGACTLPNPPVPFGEAAAAGHSAVELLHKLPANL